MAEKPAAKHPKPPALSWCETQKYLEDKYHVNLHNYKPEEPPRQGEEVIQGFGNNHYVRRSFLDHIREAHDLHNGSYFTLWPEEWFSDDRPPEEWWISEIYQILADEFGNNQLLFWIQW